MTTSICAPNMEDIANWIDATLARSRELPPETVRTERESGGEIDSLEGVEIIIAAEAEYGIAIEDHELTTVCSSPHKMAELIAAKVGAAGRREGGIDART